jgi:hypothetical protein
MRQTEETEGQRRSHREVRHQLREQTLLPSHRSQCEGNLPWVSHKCLKSSTGHNEIYFSNWVIVRVNPIPPHTSDKIECLPACSWVALKIIEYSE